MQIGSGDVFVRRAGDTISGQLIINSGANIPLILNRDASAPATMVDLQTAAASKATININNAEPAFKILSGAGTERLALNLTTGVISTAIAPLAVIGASGSLTQSAVAANSWGTGTFNSGTAAADFLAATVSDDGVNITSTGICSRVSTGPRGGWAGTNILYAARNVLGNPAAGITVYAGYNNTAAPATVTIYWTEIGR